MPDFTTVQEAQASAQSKMADGTYTVAYGGVKKEGVGTPCMHVLRPLTNTGGGQWDEVVTLDVSLRPGVGNLNIASVAPTVT